MDDIEMTPVKSSNVAAVGYDEETRTLRVEFIEGGTYELTGVPKEYYTGLIESPSPGSYYHRNLRDRFHADRID